MSRLYKAFGVVLFIVLCICMYSIAEETITLKTYYPAPSGIYTNLVTWKLGVGDTNGDAQLTELDLPSNNGEIRADGIIRSDSGFNVNRSLGLSGPYNIVTGVARGSGPGMVRVTTRSLTFVGGILTSQTADSSTEFSVL